MAHEITATDHMVSASNKTPWHGLGTILPGNLTAAEALTAAKLGWQVTQETVFDGDMKTVEGFRLNRRSDTRDVLGIVADTWEPVQNDRVLDIAEALAQVDGTEFRPVVETAGSLRGGRVVWALVKTGERAFADSPHSSYLLLSNGHDGSRALRATLTDVRVVCANTLRCAEAAASQLYVSHARGVEKRVKTAIETLGWANEATRSTFAIYEALAVTPVDVDNAARLFRTLLVKEGEKVTDSQLDAVNDMVDLYRKGPGCAGRSAFDVLNAVTDYVDHHKPMRDDGNIPERRFLATTLGGPGDRLKTDAFRAVRKLVVKV